VALVGGLTGRARPDDAARPRCRHDDVVIAVVGMRSRARRAVNESRAVRAARGARWTTWIAAVSALLLVSFGVRLGHMAAVEHVVCEHGELSHAHSSSPLPVASAVTSDDGATATSGATAREDGHDHCDVTAAHHRLPTVTPNVAAATLLTLLLPSAPSSVEGCSPLDALSLAPKNSPPTG
jgi:hypothetical protein